MILQALFEYYQRISMDTGSMASEGFEKKEIPFLIIINRKGEFVNLQDTRQGEGKKKTGRIFIIPKSVKRSSGIAANMLWDSPAYVLGRPKIKKEQNNEDLQKRAMQQHQAFISRIKDTFADSNDDGILAVLAFLNKADYSGIISHPSWQEIEDRGFNLTFQLEGDTEIICQRPGVLNVISHPQDHIGENLRKCLVTGEMAEPVRLHTSIKGVWGAQPAGANIVSFNLDAFNSYCKTQGFNAPVSKKAEFAYTTALNSLLAKGSRQRLQVGDASTVFWASRPHQMEDLFGGFFGEPTKESPDQVSESIKALYSSPITGTPPLNEDLTPFFVLGLSPNASRIAVRFWYSGTVGEVARNLRQHFNDLSVVHSQRDPDYPSLFRLLVSTAVKGKSENIPHNLAGDFIKSALTGSPYPQTLLGAVIRRIRAEHNIYYSHAALIKAALCRDARYYNQIKKEVDVSLDLTNNNPGYRLGRLFAVLERVQELANPGLNATIRDRFYGSASATPIAAFPHLLKLKNYHIAKLDYKGMAVKLEKLIGEIMDGLTDIPTNLSLADQGRFAIGYYHQRQSFFSKEDSK